jgi:hypothetical protein
VFVFRRGPVDGGSRPASSRFDVSLDVGPGETLTSPLLAGFALAVGQIFEISAPSGSARPGC